jgi:hypothetical protein
MGVPEGKQRPDDSLLSASNAFNRFAESFAGNGCRPAFSESPGRCILHGNVVSEGLGEGVEMVSSLIFPLPGRERAG